MITSNECSYHFNQVNSGSSTLHLGCRSWRNWSCFLQVNTYPCPGGVYSFVCFKQFNILTVTTLYYYLLPIMKTELSCSHFISLGQVFADVIGESDPFVDTKIIRWKSKRTASPLQTSRLYIGIRLISNRISAHNESQSWRGISIMVNLRIGITTLADQRTSYHRLKYFYVRLALSGYRGASSVLRMHDFT